MMSSLCEDTVQVDTPGAMCETARPPGAGQRAGEATARRLRRARVHFKPAASRQLQTAFSGNQYPDYDDRSRLAALIGVSEPRVQTWFQNKRSRVLRQLRQDDRSGRTSGVEAAGKRNKTDASVPTSRNHKRLRIDTNEATTFESQYMCSKKLLSLPEQQRQQQFHPGFHLPMSPLFGLPSIQPHLPPSPGRLVVSQPQPGWTDCFLSPPPTVCRQHQQADAAAVWAAYGAPFSHLMLCLPLANRDTFVLGNSVSESLTHDTAQTWRQDLSGCRSGYVMF